MGQKTNPIGLRTAVTKEWASKWYAEKKHFADFLAEDRAIRGLLKSKLTGAAVTKILIERAVQRVRIKILTARPGVVIGRRGAEIDKIKEQLSRMTGKEIYVDIQEIRVPEIDAQLVAENVAMQLERRIAFRRAMKRAVQTAMDFGAEGIRVRCAGRLGGQKLPVWNSTLRAAFRCTLYGRTLITALRKPKPKRGYLASSVGFALVRINLPRIRVKR